MSKWYKSEGFKASMYILKIILVIVILLIVFIYGWYTLFTNLKH